MTIVFYNIKFFVNTNQIYLPIEQPINYSFGNTMLSALK